MAYEWDCKKSESNLKKHGIDFADAVGVFEDEWSLTLKEHHAGNEQRFVTMGWIFLVEYWLLYTRTGAMTSV
jgi:hypothetical protein